MASIMSRLDAIQRAVEGLRVGGMVVTFPDGNKATVTAERAIMLCQNRAITKAEGGNGYLAELLTALCTN